MPVADLGHSMEEHADEPIRTEFKKVDLNIYSGVEDLDIRKVLTASGYAVKNQMKIMCGIDADVIVDCGRTSKTLGFILSWKEGIFFKRERFLHFELPWNMINKNYVFKPL